MAAGLALGSVLTSCQSPGSAVLVAGASAPQAGEALAHFESIQDLAVDSQDNIYVSDGQPGTDSPVILRRIAPDGSVSTFAGGADVNSAIPNEGPLENANLVGLRGLAIRDDVLYLTGLNCIRTIDLKASGFSLKTHWGSCLTSEEFQTSLTGTGLKNLSKPALFNEHLLVTADRTIYADVAGDESARHIFKLGNSQAEPEQLNYPYEMFGMGIDSQGALFMSHPWPDANGPGYIEKWSPPQKPLRLFPGAGQIITDSRDNVYFLDGTTITRYAPDNRSKTVGKLTQSNLSRSVARLALNPAETALYISAGTAVYRFPLTQ
ncbi:MAG: hypothetical protein ACAI44_28395 [Candidatus Sericytochromatia bacterium]